MAKRQWRLGSTLLFMIVCAGPSSGYTLLDFPSDGAVETGEYKQWIVDDSGSRPFVDMSYSVQSDLLLGLGGATQAAHNAIRSWDAGTPIIAFSPAGYEPVVNSAENWVAGYYAWEGAGAQAGSSGIGANIDIMSRPGDFEFSFRNKIYSFGEHSLAFAVPVAFSGNVVSADVYLNSDYQWSTSGNGFDVETVVLHEIGHALGLDHPDQAAANGAENYQPWTNESGRDPTIPSVMRSTYFPLGRTRRLSEDEVGGLAFLYGLIPGDANLDGLVDGNDLSILGANFGGLDSKLWRDGDFNADNTVSGADLATIGMNWMPSDDVFIPEPAAVSAVAVGGLALIIRRKRR